MLSFLKIVVKKKKIGWYKTANRLFLQIIFFVFYFGNCFSFFPLLLIVNTGEGLYFLFFILKMVFFLEKKKKEDSWVQAGKAVTFLL